MKLGLISDIHGDPVALELAWSHLMLMGADRIIWASDYPHPDAKFPGVTAELAEASAVRRTCARRWRSAVMSFLSTPSPRPASTREVERPRRRR